MNTNQRALPQELVDCVIDHLHGDRPTLKACALVSKSWTPSSYIHLFHFVHIAGADQLQCFVFFLRLSPVFVSFVQTLRYNEGIIFGPSTGPATSTQGSALHDVLRYLPNLRSLVLWEVDFARHLNCSSIPARRFTLEALTIRESIVTSFDLERILRTFDEIGTLSLLRITPFSDPDTPHDEIPTSRFESTPIELTKVHSIRTKAARNYKAFIDSILATFKRQIVPDSLNALDLLLQPDLIDVFETFLDGLLPNLQDLNVDFRCPAIRLGSCESLDAL